MSTKRKVVDQPADGQSTDNSHTTCGICVWRIMPATPGYGFVVDDHAKCVSLIRAPVRPAAAWLR
jgi:hypothetical protein